MLADRHRIRSITRTFDATGINLLNMREITGLAVKRRSDDYMKARVVSAIVQAEKKTGYKLFPGTYTAEFRHATLIRNNNYTIRPIVIPGTNSTILSIKFGTNVVTANDTDVDANGTTIVYPPEGGWFTQANGYQGSMIVEYTAGGNVSNDIVDFIGIITRYNYFRRKEDSDLIKEMNADLYVMDEG